MDPENKVSKMFIISLGNWIALELLNQPMIAHLVPEKYNKVFERKKGNVPHRNLVCAEKTKHIDSTSSIYLFSGSKFKFLKKKVILSHTWNMKIWSNKRLKSKSWKHRKWIFQTLALSKKECSKRRLSILFLQCLFDWHLRWIYHAQARHASTMQTGLWNVSQEDFTRLRVTKLPKTNTSDIAL